MTEPTTSGAAVEAHDEVEVSGRLVERQALTVRDLQQRRGGVLFLLLLGHQPHPLPYLGAKVASSRAWRGWKRFT